MNADKTPDRDDRRLITTPHDGHPSAEICPSCPHTPTPDVGGSLPDWCTCPDDCDCDGVVDE